MDEVARVGALTESAFWDAHTFNDQEASGLPFSPDGPEFGDVHRAISACVGEGRGRRALEIGCFPGRYLWYFNRVLGFSVGGIEYRPAAAARARGMLKAIGVDADVRSVDLFDEAGRRALGRWDVVSSFGFVEHFTDVDEVCRLHWELVAPGGTLVIVVPNHSGIYGWLMERLDPEAAPLHNRMDWPVLRDAVSALPGSTLLRGGYVCRFGLSATNVYARAARLGRLAYVGVRAPFWAAERLGQLVPNSARFSPYIAVVARKEQGS